MGAVADYTEQITKLCDQAEAMEVEAAEFRAEHLRLATAEEWHAHEAMLDAARRCRAAAYWLDKYMVKTARPSRAVAR